MTHSHSETDHEQEHETRKRKSTSSPKQMNGYTSHPPPTIRTNSNSSSSSSPSSSSPASPSSPSSPPRAHPIPTDPSTWPEGHTDKGETFRIPPTLNTINMFHPKNLSLPGIVTVTLAATSLSLILFGNFPKWFHILIFLFFRVCYNVGLGAILSTQSLHRSFTHFYEHVMSDRQSWRARLFAHLAMCTLPYELRRTYTIDSFPTAFNAWLVYKNLVNLILFNDSFNYLFLGIKCFHWPEEITVLVIAQYAVGIFLCVFNYWAKLDAHRCIGEYCWYWGDFFYRKDENLTFDGIFELFPHPMYTVGYSLYYGYSLICRSYTMLFVSITAHLAQLAFLVIVEEPHIERTYGSPQTLDKSQMRVLYDPREGLFPTKDSIFFFHLDLTNSGDVANVLLCVYTAVVCVTVTDPFWTILQVVVWRVLHWLGMGIILWNQSRRQWWTRRYIERGRTLYEAFSHWKKLYNMSLTVNVVAFVGCAIRHFEFSWADLFSGYRMAMIVIGVLLILLSIWSVNSTYQVVGDFGWFYGDFFVSENTYQQQVCYTGIYRFLNNPDCVTGYAGLYGLSLITQSYALFGLALLAQSLNIAFLNIVEIPHMQKLYDNKIRVENPHYRAIKKFLPGMPEPIRQSELKLKQQARTIRLKAMTEVYQLYKKIAEERKSRRGSQSRGSEITIRAPESHTLGTPLTIEFETNENHSDTDWIGIYPVGVPSVPGVSEGKWMYVTPGATGTLTFSSSLLPTSEGVYELRYHRSNQYKIQAKIPIMLESPPMTEDQMMNDDEDMGSPMTSPKASAANTPSKWSKETKKTH